MNKGEAVPDFKPPPHPKGISLEGERVRLVPLDAGGKPKVSLSSLTEPILHKKDDMDFSR